MNEHKKGESQQTMGLGSRLILIFVSMITAGLVWMMLDSGETISRSDGHLRDERPTIFWIYVCAFSLASIILFIISVWPYGTKNE